MKYLKNRIGLYTTYLLNLIKKINWKIQYGNAVKMPFLLCLGKHSHLSIKNNGQIALGEKIESRNGLHIMAHGGNISIGNHCFFNINCSITSVDSIKIGDECKIGNNVVFVDHDHNYKYVSDKEFISSPIIVGDNVWIGAGCIILRGSKIGNDSVIAAGSIVKGEVPKGMLYVNKAASVGELKPINQ